MDEKKNGVKPENEEKPIKKAAEVAGNKDVDFITDRTLTLDDDSEGRALSTTDGAVDTGYPIHHRITLGDKGRTYDNYAIVFGISAGGQLIKKPIRLRPKRKGGSDLMEEMRFIMSMPGEHNLEVTRTVMTSDGRTSVSYALSVSCMLDNGIPYSCPLEPVGVGDKSLWETLKLQLIAEGILQ